MTIAARIRRERRSGRGAGGGFTLVEVLVALLILAIMSALGYSTYRSASIAALRAQDSMNRTREIEFGLRIMAQDFSQAAPRPVRDPLGSTRQPSLRAGLGRPTLVDLTRAGWSNTAGMQRSTLQRVSYQLTGDRFQRSYLTVLDPTQTTAPIVQDLLTGVSKVTLNYLDGNQVWNNQWPPATLPQPESLWTRPVAVEIIIEFKDWGRVRRLVEIAG